MKEYQKNFIDMLIEPTKEGFKTYKILPSLTIAQAILETGWGKHTIGNNIFGIKANSTWRGPVKVVTTHEYINGKKVTIQAKFRDYPSIYDSLQDRYKLLSESRYKKVVGEEDYKKACTEVWRAGYASDPNYPQKLIQLIELYNLHKIDKEVIDMNKDSVDNSNQSPDVVSDYARESWMWGKKMGLILGGRPKDPITREEAVEILSRYEKLTNK